MAYLLEIPLDVWSLILPYLEGPEKKHIEFCLKPLSFVKPFNPCYIEALLDVCEDGSEILDKIEWEQKINLFLHKRVWCHRILFCFFFFEIQKINMTNWNPLLIHECLKVASVCAKTNKTAESNGLAFLGWFFEQEKSKEYAEALFPFVIESRSLEWLILFHGWIPISNIVSRVSLDQLISSKAQIRFLKSL